MKPTAGIKADITIYPIYTCSICGKGEAGDSIHETIRGYSAEEISMKIEKIEYKAAYMPVGWGNGPSGFFCQCTSGL